MLPEKKFTPQVLRLISDFRGIPESSTEMPMSLPVTFSDAFRKAFVKKLPSDERIRSFDLLNTYWKDWFQGTDFLMCVPERIDKWNCLWIKAPNAIVRQRLQFKTVYFLNTINHFLPIVIKEIRWT